MQNVCYNWNRGKDSTPYELMQFVVFSTSLTNFILFVTFVRSNYDRSLIVYLVHHSCDKYKGSMITIYFVHWIQHLILKLWILNYKMHNWKAFYYDVLQLYELSCGLFEQLLLLANFKSLFKFSLEKLLFQEILSFMNWFAYSECDCNKSFATIITFE